MRSVFVRVLSVILIGIIVTPQTFGAALTAADTSSASTRTLPPIDPGFLRGYLPPADNPDLATRLTRIPVIEADIYGAIASELAYKAAEHRNDFYTFMRLKQTLSADYLASLGDPALALFAGWKIIGILNTIPEPGEDSMVAAAQTDLFALTLEAANGFKITTVRGTDPKSVHNLLTDFGFASHHDVPKLGATFVQKNNPWGSLAAGVAIQFIPEALRESASSYASTAATAMGYVGSVAAQHAKSKSQQSVEEADTFFRASDSDMAVGHSLAGMLANGILRARKLLGGDGAAMEDRMQYIGNFGGMGMQALIPEIARILNPEAPPVANSALVGKDLARYREFFRHGDAVGSSGKHIGTCIPLGPYLSDAILGIAAVAAPPADVAVVAGAGEAGTSVTPAGREASVETTEAAAPEGVMSGILTTVTYYASGAVNTVSAAGSAVASYTSGALATTVSATGTAVTYVKTLAAQPAKTLLEAHSCQRMMRELLMALAHQTLAT